MQKTMNNTLHIAHPRTILSRLITHCVASTEPLSINVRREVAIRRMLTILTDCPNVLFDGDEVRIDVGPSATSLLLSEGPDGATCLGPSSLLPPGAVAKKCLPVQPDWLPVSGPRGTYSLIRVSATNRLPPRFVRKWRDRPPGPLAPAELQALSSWLAGQSEPARIAVAPYVVFA